MSDDKKNWDLVVNLGSSPAVESKTNFTCAGSDPSCVWSGKIRLHSVRCWNMGNWTKPRATLIKAELCQAGLINKAPKTPQMGVVQDQTQPALTQGWEAREAPFEAQPGLCWGWPNVSSGLWSCCSKCHRISDQTKAQVPPQTMTKGGVREKQGQPQTSITCQGHNIILVPHRVCFVRVSGQNRGFATSLTDVLSLHI